MIFTSYRYKNKNLSLIGAVILSLTSLLGLQACGGGSSTPAEGVKADPSGYYTGTASVKQADNSTAFEITDLQVFVSGTRIMAMSVDHVILYDITVTDITENTVTGSVNVYRNGVLLDTTTLTGTIAEGTSLTGTFAGAGIVNGSFTVSYDTIVNAVNAVTAETNIFGWTGYLNADTAEIGFDNDSAGFVTGSTFSSSSNSPVFQYCKISTDNTSTFTAINGLALYSVTFVMQSCTDTNVDGTYTGFGIIKDSQSVTAGLLPMAFSNANFAGTINFSL